MFPGLERARRKIAAEDFNWLERWLLGLDPTLALLIVLAALWLTLSVCVMAIAELLA